MSVAIRILRWNCTFLPGFFIFLLVTPSLSAQSFLTEVWLKKAEQEMEAIGDKQTKNENAIAEEYDKLQKAHETYLIRLSDLPKLLEEWKSVLAKKDRMDSTWKDDLEMLSGDLEDNGYEIENWESGEQRCGMVFTNNLGGVIILSKSPEDPAMVIFSIQKFPSYIIELYESELFTCYRKVEEVDSLDYTDSLATTYIDRGGRLYVVDDGWGSRLDIYVTDNTQDSMGFNLPTEKITNRAILVTPWSSSTTIRFARGEVFTISAHEEINLKETEEDITAEGIAGSETNCIDSRFPFGSLIGKIGQGDWFFVGGEEKFFTAADSGQLTLKINARNIQDSEGYFIVLINNGDRF